MHTVEKSRGSLLDRLYSPKILGPFLDRNFIHLPQLPYPKFVETALWDRPHRPDNPDYLQYFGSIAMMVAENAFHEMTAHVVNALARKYKRDPFDPRYLLAMGSYLGILNVQSFEQKLQILSICFKKCV